WLLAGAIRRGLPYEVVEWGEISHFALRTPGYPAFLAACRFLFGDRPLAARLVQAVLGTVAVWLVYRLTRQAVPEAEERPGWSRAMVAAALAAFYPYSVATSALLLSEAVFVPLMLASLWGLAVLWRSDETRPAGIGREWGWALGTGFASGAAVLV